MRRRDPFDKLVARLRAAIESAATRDEFEAARVAVREAMPPREADRTDLADVCARKWNELVKLYRT